MAGNPLQTLKTQYVVKLMFTTGQSAVAEIGQPNFTTRSAQATAANTLNNPYGAVAVGPNGQLFVPDYSNARILVFDTIPSTNNASASFVLGQPDFTSGAASQTQAGFTGPQTVSIARGKMLVTHRGSDQVVLYNKIPSATGDLPNIALGDPPFTTDFTICTDRNLGTPESAIITDEEDAKVIVADSSRHRVLIWLHTPTRNGQPADLVLGQNDMTHCIFNDDNQVGIKDPSPTASYPRPTARTLNYPSGVWSDGKRLVVLDSRNNRALIWNTFPTRNFQEADLVLGQPNFTIGNSYVAAPDTLDYPYIGVASNGVQLAVSDRIAKRVLIWNSFPTRSHQPADVVLGQKNFSRSDRDDTAADTISYPTGLTFYGDKLFVTDADNSRILMFQAQ